MCSRTERRLMCLKKMMGKIRKTEVLSREITKKKKKKRERERNNKRQSDHLVSYVFLRM